MYYLKILFIKFLNFYKLKFLVFFYQFFLSLLIIKIRVFKYKIINLN